MRVVREDPVRKGMLYAGTERGVYVSFDDGGHWKRLQRNLPPVPVHDLVVKDNDLVAATHGRSFWIMDDVSLLRTLAPEITASAMHLFPPQPAWRIYWGGAQAFQNQPAGQNPPSGAIIDYWVKSADQKVTIELLDGAGKSIKTFTSEADTFAYTDSTHFRAKLDSLRDLGVMAASVDTNVIRRVQPEAEEAPAHPGAPDRAPNKKGMNRFVWDLQYPDAAWFSRMVLWTGFLQGPTAVPGNYTVKVTVGDKTETESFTLKNDPRSTASQKDLEEQFALQIKIRDAVSAANNGVRTIRNVKAQMAARVKAVGRQQSPRPHQRTRHEAQHGGGTAVLGAEPRGAGHAELSDQAQRPARLALLHRRERRRQADGAVVRGVQGAERVARQAARRAEAGAGFGSARHQLEIVRSEAGPDRAGDRRPRAMIFAVRIL